MSARAIHTHTCTADGCGVTFGSPSRLAVFCSRDCGRRDRKMRTTPASRVCGYTECARPFAPRDNRQLYCSPVCTDKAYRDAHRHTDSDRAWAPSLASVARRGPVVYVPKPIRWISAVPPVVMAEAQAEYRAMLAREAAASGPGRKRGRPIHVGNARALARRVGA